MLWAALSVSPRRLTSPSFTHSTERTLGLLEAHILVLKKKVPRFSVAFIHNLQTEACLFGVFNIPIAIGLCSLAREYTAIVKLSSA